MRRSLSSLHRVTILGTQWVLWYNKNHWVAECSTGRRVVGHYGKRALLTDLTNEATRRSERRW